MTSRFETVLERAPPARGGGEGRPARGRNAERAAAGFTLFEMIIVLALAGLMLGLALSVARRPVSPTTRTVVAAREIAAALRSARLQAITANRPVSVTFDIVNHRYQIGASGWRPVAPEVDMALLTTAGAGASGSSGRVRFAPDGSASGGRVTLSGGGRTLWVGIDWLTGRISEAEARTDAE
jgi:general secretion pathway protein H